MIDDEIGVFYVVVHVLLLIFFFFFSSRRRHTRLQGDWSSDVCSSDLWWYLPSVSVRSSTCSLTCSQAAALTGLGSSSSTTPSSRRCTWLASTGCLVVTR